MTMPRDVYGPSSSARLGEGPLLRFAYKPHTKTVTFLVVVLQATASMMCWKTLEYQRYSSFRHSAAIGMKPYEWSRMSTSQTVLYRRAASEHIGTSSGLLRTSIYIGSIGASSLSGVFFGETVTDGGLHGIGITVAVLGGRRAIGDGYGSYVAVVRGSCPHRE